jgi:transposase-like protein
MNSDDELEPTIEVMESSPALALPRDASVRTEIGDNVRVAVPRDRAGSFEPVTVPVGQRRLSGLDQMVISLYAKGLTTGDIASHLFDVYDQQVDPSTISRITDAVVADMESWQSRPLDAVYPVLLVDGIRIKIRDGTVSNRLVYVVMGVNLDGERDVLGLWVGPTGGESPKFWLGVFAELKNRGVGGYSSSGSSSAAVENSVSSSVTLPSQ